MSKPRWQKLQLAWYKQAYFLSKPIKSVDKWQWLRKRAKQDISPQAQLKLEGDYLLSNCRSRNAKATASQFGITRKTLHKWLKRFNENNLGSLAGGYRYLLTAIDEVSKIAFARLYTTHSSKQAKDFLERLMYLTDKRVINLHHDNGSEFKDHFERACEQLHLPQWLSRPHTPKDKC